MEKIELGKRIEEEIGSYLGLNLLLAPPVEEENSRERHTDTHTSKQTKPLPLLSCFCCLLP
jgi:hypothetical protein